LKFLVTHLAILQTPNRINIARANPNNASGYLSICIKTVKNIFKVQRTNCAQWKSICDGSVFLPVRSGWHWTSSRNKNALL